MCGNFDKFVMFKPKNDPAFVYIARESFLPKCREYDEKVFLKPFEERTQEERKPPQLFPDSDIEFINAHNTLVRFEYDKNTQRFYGELLNGESFTEENAQAICDQLNEACERIIGGAK